MLLDMNFFAHQTIFGELASAGLLIAHVPMNVSITDGRAFDEFLQIHDLEHRSIASQIGVSAPSDLSSWNTKDADQFSAWTAAHANHHALIAQALGL